MQFSKFATLRMVCLGATTPQDSPAVLTPVIGEAARNERKGKL